MSNDADFQQRLARIAAQHGQPLQVLASSRAASWSAQVHRWPLLLGTLVGVVACFALGHMGRQMQAGDVPEQTQLIAGGIVLFIIASTALGLIMLLFRVRSVFFFSVGEVAGIAMTFVAVFLGGHTPLSAIAGIAGGLTAMFLWLFVLKRAPQPEAAPADSSARQLGAYDALSSDSIIQRGDRARRSQASGRQGFRIGPFLIGFVLSAAAFSIVARLNDIQAHFESTTPVGAIALACGIVIAILGGGMVRAALAIAAPATPKTATRRSRALGSFLGFVVGIGPALFVEKMREKFSGFAGGLQW